ncbi:GTP 3',8-cyclase MoaA [Peribacillus deserti]|uniref:GTP 3',8-cyclase n=1 Tax=Peribacillus deserti TaxID=673318 RepID=A0A2N5M7Q5_9BACI|nr:GTP 3',8-cyclase MoaA [Peribacillus deserti]PLT30408.1 GTP 3',8-cyclase MoaA [Peribacillus deserti]
MSEIRQINDALQRPLRDLRISVIDRCNLRCQYCMPADIFGDSYKFLPSEELLSFEEIERAARLFAELGVEKIRLTGGEPLLRKNLPKLINQLSHLNGIKDIALTTNGILLPRYAQELKDAGLQRVNISLDSIDDDLFKEITGRSIGVKPVLQGIQAAKKSGLEVKINMVVKKGMNDSQILPMAEYCKNENLILRFIEFMDVGNTNGWKLDHVISKKEIIEMISRRYSIEPVDPDYYGEVAKRYRYRDEAPEIGFITSVSESFCSTCTRARLSANGQFYTCLFSSAGFNLKESLRSRLSDKEITDQITSIWNKRNDRYSDERNEQKTKTKPKIEMSYIGG